MKRIIFLDDEKAILNTYKRVTHSMDLECFFCTTTKEAEDSYNNNSINLIISDYRLENETGLDFLSNIREKNNSIPMIIVSGYAEETLIKKALNKKIIQDYMLKPISLNIFKELIERYTKEGVSYE